MTLAVWPIVSVPAIDHDGPVSWAKPADAERWQQEVGKRLRAAREAKGYTQAALAERADLSVAYISSVELGHRNISLINIVVLAVSLDVDPGLLVADLKPGLG